MRPHEAYATSDEFIYVGRVYVGAAVGGKSVEAQLIGDYEEEIGLCLFVGCRIRCCRLSGRTGRRCENPGSNEAACLKEPASVDLPLSMFFLICLSILHIALAVQSYSGVSQMYTSSPLTTNRSRP